MKHAEMQRLKPEGCTKEGFGRRGHVTKARKRLAAHRKEESQVHHQVKHRNYGFWSPKQN
jgi:hypothetical protein